MTKTSNAELSLTEPTPAPEPAPAPSPEPGPGARKSGQASPRRLVALRQRLYGRRAVAPTRTSSSPHTRRARPTATPCRFWPDTKTSATSLDMSGPRHPHRRHSPIQKRPAPLRGAGRAQHRPSRAEAAQAHPRKMTPTPPNPRGVSIHSIFSRKYLRMNSLKIPYIN